MYESETLIVKRFRLLNSNKEKQIKIGNTVENGEEIIKEIRELLIREKVIL